MLCPKLLHYRSSQLWRLASLQRRNVMIDQDHQDYKYIECKKEGLYKMYIVDQYHWHVLVCDEKWLSANFQRHSCWKISITILVGASSIKYQRVTATLPSNWSLCCQGRAAPLCVVYQYEQKSNQKKSPLAILFGHRTLPECIIVMNAPV